MQILKPRAFVLAQTLPASTGLGAAMRLGCWVEALAQTHSVTLVVVSMDPTVTPEALAPKWLNLVSDCLVLNVHQAAQAMPPATLIDDIFALQPKLLKRWPLQLIKQELAPYQGQSFEYALIVRLRLMPVWRLLTNQLQVKASTQVLDLDDIESRAQARQVLALGRSHFGRLGYWLALLEARKLDRAELQASQCMHRMSVCSAQDLATLALRIAPAQLCVVPNAIHLPVQQVANPALASTKPLQLLFVGALDYQPNSDAVRWLLDTIWPQIKKVLAPQSVKLAVVGRKPPAWLQHAAEDGDFALHANVPDLQPYYQQAHAVLVPLRSGGGTRIKILEAFAFGRPVVSTTIGAEGLGVVHGRELLLADTPADFALQCAQLISDPERMAQIVRVARARVEVDFSQTAFQRHAQAAFAPSERTSTRGS